MLRLNNDGNLSNQITQQLPSNRNLGNSIPQQLPSNNEDGGLNTLGVYINPDEKNAEDEDKKPSNSTETEFVLNIDSTAQPWTFESNTLKGDSQGPYVISAKHKSYSKVVRDQNSCDISLLMTLQGLSDEFTPTLKSANHSDGSVTFTSKEMGIINAALGLAAASMVLWVLAIAAYFFRSKVGTHDKSIYGPNDV